ncbi:MAG: GNAT family N-acetyltransferase [Candidatus Eiseniibacteriota bacterium]|jgi:GNAT superfamily N-acetyltransferase
MVTGPVPTPDDAGGRSQGDDDERHFWRVRKLLVTTHSIAPTGFNWEVRRWDGWRWYDGGDGSRSRNRLALVHLEGTTGDRLAGAVHPEGPGEAHLEVHPEHREVEAPLLDWAEAHLAAVGRPSRAPGTGEAGAERVLRVPVNDYDVHRRRLLERRGYTGTGSGGHTYRMRLAGRESEAPLLAAGYTLRSPDPADDADCQALADLLNVAFGRTIHVAAEYRNFATRAPSYRAGLDLVALAPDGTWAAYLGVPLDGDNRLGIFEPLCTHPEHRRRGLGRALMGEAVRRLRALGVTEVLVGTGEAMAARRTYESAGFAEAHHWTWWERLLPAGE